MKKNELEWIYCSNKQVTSKFKISSVKKVSSELIKWYDDSFHRLRIETMLKTKLYQQMFRSMRYSYRSFDFRFNLGTLYIFNTAFRVVNDFFSFPDIMYNMCIALAEHPVFLPDTLLMFLWHPSLRTHHKTGVRVFH